MPPLPLDRWSETAGGAAQLVNLSENHTYRVDAPAGTAMLRIHRPGYHDASAIRSELAWLEALRRETDLPVVRPLPGRDGDLVQEAGPGRFAVLFAFIPGKEPVEPTPELFETLGRYAATTHSHVASWQPPPAFTRPRWSAATMLEPDGLWGDWRVAPGVAPVRATLDAVSGALHQVLAAYGTAPSRFGLIHADMRLANLLADGPRLSLLDFDDCGFGWFLYDLAAALSFIETRPDVPRLRDAWLEGYTRLRALDAADIGIIPAMVLLRRLVLLAWIGTHGETELARSQMPRFAADTAELGRAWLAGL